MFEFFTWLVIEYQIDDTMMQRTILFETYDHCQQVLRIDALYDVFYDNYEQTSMICEETDVKSGMTWRPKLRPE